MIIVREPSSSAEFEEYYELRYRILRAPWGHARGSEKDTEESTSIHFAAFDQKKIVGVCRLQKNNTNEGQVRFMAVAEEAQGKGIGKQLMKAAEEKARELKMKDLVLQARENAMPFYLSIGYSVSEKTFKLWDIIQHFKMQKTL